MPKSPNLYYAHSMKIYRTPTETKELTLIGKRFVDHSIINPRDYEGHPEKVRDKMAFCKRLVSTCKTLVFTRWEGDITAGVVIEANHAIDNNIAVFELAGKKFLRHSKHVIGLSYAETLDRYDWLPKRLRM